MHGLVATRAYQARSADRNLREQEADVFRRATAALRHAENDTDVSRTRALADNSLLWTTLVITLKDSTNALPEPLRASMISIGLVVQRELSAQKPDFSFIIGINEQMTAGLMGV
ncbi:MAG: flagellar biosynthesis regulator FlaF [Acetobacteraceae bacterium]|nr:flagellar biosynthesis regulator FlaF [Acetobacteraceae bacterium]